MTHLRYLWLFFFSYAFAFPPLVPYQQGNTQLMTPQGWTVAIDEVQGIISINENPNDPASASLLMFTAAQQANLTPEIFAQNFLTTAVANFQVIEQNLVDDHGGLLVTVTGTVDGIPAKVAVLSFYDTSFGVLRLVAFAATPQRFEELGGAGLIYVTFGGQDPNQLANNQPTTGYGEQTTNYGGALVCEDFIGSYTNYSELTLEYDKHQCIVKNSQSVANNVLLGKWSQALGSPSAGTWENVVTGEVSYDSSGYGISLLFHENGQYELLYLYSASNYGCSSKVEAYETGSYSLDGQSLSLTLQPESYEANLDTCYGPPSKTSGSNLPLDRLEVGFHPNLADMALTFRCREFVISCADDGYLRILLKHE